MGSLLDKNQTGNSWTTFANILGYLFIAGGLGMIIFRHFLCYNYLGFVATLFVHDAYLDIGPKGFTLFLIGAGALLLILGLVILLRKKRPFCFLFTFLNGYFLHKEIRRFFFPPHCFLPQTYYLITFWVSLFITYLLIFLFRFHFSPLIEPIFMEDGILEWMTVINLLLSCILLLSSIYLLFRRDTFKVNKYIAIVTMVIITLFCLFFMLEEISYGQRMFGWEAKGVFEYNYQQETNLHNFLNPMMDDLSNMSGTLLFFLLVFGWIRQRESQSITFRVLFPHPSLFFITASLFAITATGQSDVMEEILSILTLIYSLTVWFILFKRPGMDSSS